ncbi:hypothetical protein B7P43_G17289 [Cryptotermes secundus]|uniref:Coiled-coil protein 142 C-terminal domain-containing protein n=2 Tax=Cryptotermes secundus TaxID=105785 RepID=A0A2J7PBD3_9NEOP|nr:hypothetical protein B7P43_G17289 [Cryptotermes secundus]PNF13638.1 hypothetical protein B7P43_G17289 [Cryptotermes secundus]PNF13641.1 hypothetical protein B7P43_G17289 [Cryptotermes secundus]PNF13642.1 hypothetical protein B7P43_G17289 [Cryptotermes secundus]
MFEGEWLEVESEKTQIFYHDCQDLHYHSVLLSGKLRDILLSLHRNALKGSQNKEAENEIVDLENLSYTTDAMQSVVESFKSLSLHEMPSDMKSVMHTTSSVDSSSLGSYKAVNTAPIPGKKDKSPLFRFKTSWWRDILWKDRLTLAYLTYHTVTEILTRCNKIAEQNHNHCTLENLFRLSSLYNEVLALGAQDNKGVATFCRNTCPILQHPLRKLSVTKIIQVLAQSHAENCCHSLVNSLLDIYKPTDTHISVMDCNGMTTPDNSNSSIEIYEALTQHMTPPCVTSELPPVERVGAVGMKEIATLQTRRTCSPELERLLVEEEAHVSVLLSVAAHSAPHLLGSGGVKPSRTSGMPRVSKQVRTKVIEYYQQVLWGEVGAFSEHVLLWWRDGPLIGTLPPESCQLLCEWLRSVVSSGVVPELVVPAVHSLADGLGCHVTTTLWDQLFRQTLVQGHKFAYSADKEKGSVCGRLFADLLHQLVSLSNACEPMVPIDLLPTQALEDLPLVEQIPVLHRLDHSVHTARLWAANTARHLVNAWSVDAFFVITQTDISLCLTELQMLKLTDHKGFSEMHSEHVMVCAKMRSKLTSEIRDNIRKLKACVAPSSCCQMNASRAWQLFAAPSVLPTCTCASPNHTIGDTRLVHLLNLLVHMFKNILIVCSVRFLWQCHHFPLQCNRILVQQF